MALQGYESLARLASLLNTSEYQNLLSRINGGKPRIYLGTYRKFKFQFCVDPHFITGRFARTRGNQRNNFVLKLSDIASKDILGLRYIDFDHAYTRQEIRSKFPSLVDFFQRKYPDLYLIKIQKDDIYELLLYYSEFSSVSFPIQLKRKDVQYLRATMPPIAKLGRPSRVFDDRFYDLFLIAMQPSASSFGVESIAKNVYEWIQEDDLQNESLKSLDEGTIKERVRKIYKECELKNAKAPRRK